MVSLVQIPRHTASRLTLLSWISCIIGRRGKGKELGKTETELFNASRGFGWDHSWNIGSRLAMATSPSFSIAASRKNGDHGHHLLLGQTLFSFPL